MLRGAVFVVPFALLPACGPKSDITRSIIGYAQVSSVSALDETRDGFFRALADSGYVRDSTITVLERNAQGDIPTLALIMSDFLLLLLDEHTAALDPRAAEQVIHITNQ